MRTIVRLALLAAIAGVPDATAALADEAANEALARKFYDAINTRNLDALGAIFSKDFVDHNAEPGQAPGLAGVKKSLEPFLAASSDLKITNEPVIAKGDYVTLVDTCTGTNDGPMMGMPASKKPFKFSAIDVWLVKEGKLAEGWHVEQLLQMMAQLGMAQK